MVLQNYYKHTYISRAIINAKFNSDDNDDDMMIPDPKD